MLGKSVGYWILNQRLRDLWQLEHGYELTGLEEYFYIVRFFSKEDYLKVLEGGPWIVMGHYLMVTKWRPRFRPSTAKITSTLVWMRFPSNLPELLDEETLTSMVDLLGRTMKIDHMSLTGLRCRFSRVCVEVNLDAPLLPFLTFLDLAQKVEYEGLHMICFKCGKFDYRVDDCPSLMQASPAPGTIADESGVQGQPQRQQNMAVPSKPPGEPPTMYGPWMLVN